MNHGIIGNSLEEREAIKADALLDHPSFDGERLGLLEGVGVMVAPLVYAGRDLGVLYVSREADRRGVFLRECG